MSMADKPKRRTRERILEASLRLFNDFGEPNVTTSAISDELGISPGNLYYHFRNKDEIVDDLFERFERDIAVTLLAPGGRAPTVDDIWLFLHLMFELTWKYRFLFRDLNDLLTRNRTLEIHFRQILQHKVNTAVIICEGLVARGEMIASRAEIKSLSENMVVVSTYWLSYEYVRNPRSLNEGEAMSRGIFQVMSLAAPFLVGRARELFSRLADRYLTR